MTPDTTALYTTALSTPSPSVLSLPLAYGTAQVVSATWSAPDSDDRSLREEFAALKRELTALNPRGESRFIRALALSLSSVDSGGHFELTGVLNLTRRVGTPDGEITESLRALVIDVRTDRGRPARLLVARHAGRLWTEPVRLSALGNLDGVYISEPRAAQVERRVAAFICAPVSRDHLGGEDASLLQAYLMACGASGVLEADPQPLFALLGSETGRRRLLFAARLVFLAPSTGVIPPRLAELGGAFARPATFPLPRGEAPEGLHGAEYLGALTDHFGRRSHDLWFGRFGRRFALQAVSQSVTWTCSPGGINSASTPQVWSTPLGCPDVLPGEALDTALSQIEQSVTQVELASAAR